MTTLQQTHHQTSDRPAAILRAVILSSIHAVLGVAVLSLAPDVDDRAQFVVINAVIGVILLAGAAFIWSGNRWGTIAAMVFNGLFFLMAVPELFATDPAALPFFAGAVLILAGCTIGLLMTRSARDYRSSSRSL
jgi:hypothetical protein